MKAYRRRDVAVPDPLAHLAHGERAQSPRREVEASALLELLWEVHPRTRQMLILVSDGGQVSAIARSLGLPIGTAFSRLRREQNLPATVLKWRRRLR